MSFLRPTPALLALLLGMLPAHAGPSAGTSARTPATEQGPPRARQAATAEDSREARVIVKYRSASVLMRALSAGSAAPGSTLARPLHAATLGTRLGLPMQNGRVLGERTQALRAQGLTSSALAAKLRLQDDVEWAVVDERRYISAAPNPPNDPLYAANTSISPAAGQWYLRAPDAAVTAAATPVVSSINAEAAWAITNGSAAITVAVLDTGVRFDHPDLTAKLWPGYDFVSSQTGDGDGVDADASDPGDFNTANQCGSGTAARTSSWHGTQTAGLVGAATDNNFGMASIGRNTMVLPVRVLGPCGGSDSDIIAAMYWAAGINLPGTAVKYATYAGIPVNPYPAKVISMSLGKTGNCPASYIDVFAALAAAKVTVVVAAGNSNGLAVEAPANCPGALAVAGVRHIGSKVGYSSIGPQVTIAAPAGNCVNTNGPCLYPMLTTINKGATTPSSNGYSDSTDISVGTSFAAPIVAGTVALMLSVDSALTPAVIAARIKSTARPFPQSGSGNDAAGLPIAACKAPTASEQLECYCTTTTCGAGLLDAGAAVASVVPAAAAPPTTGITLSNSAPTAGQSVTLSASSTVANNGRSIAGYQWAITSGGGFAVLAGATNASTATLTTSAAGSVVLSLTVTDNAGATGSASSTVNVQAAAVVPPTPAPTPAPAPAPGGGGGAMSGAWAALLGLAAAALWRVRRS